MVLQWNVRGPIFKTSLKMTHYYLTAQHSLILPGWFIKMLFDYLFAVNNQQYMTMWPKLCVYVRRTWIRQFRVSINNLLADSSML